MSTSVTRKRSRAKEDEDDLPPAKREHDGTEGVNSSAGPDSTQAADGQTRDRQVSKQDEEFWFDDGTVILVARGIEFRVYKGVLSGLSPVLKDLFAKRHAIRNVRMDGVPTFPCPVVHVSDSPEDLRHLLRACFSKRLGSLYGERKPSYHEISAAIRLGDKYKIIDLYSQSLEYLKSYFPRDFESWDALPDYTPPGWGASKAIGIVNLARITGELTLLPSAFVICICADSMANAIGHGIIREDGSQERLSSDDLVVCFDGKTNLRTATIAAVLRTFKPAAAAECERWAACEGALRQVLLNLEGMLGVLLGGDPFIDYEGLVDSSGPLNVCETCANMVQERGFKERKAIWDRLPELLDIDVPGW